ncbi:malonyl-[acyl-carrier protein] O-methyltransferase BioC [Seongchinamella sediminis]|uniref:Malonyl-[acyl-carrier protein] O-methyltransferase n=1 Tax=Seongchinamella sediminis TaxID=2283635 RepID=A0A3L7DY46_9GAMM|nr:malonyl-ACP O-methyltransferase BioC [Seongchinamella sediminis]RLQ22174.1 malonyl-[acyl-carrier protein] O-methyltransferase BioC [Seongchinamella sediminis]
MPTAVSIGREYLPATDAARAELVLLHGWGANRNIWRPLLPALRPWANITLLDLPGLAPGLEQADLELEDLLLAIENRVPAAAVYLGWSLGGQLAMALAARRPGQAGAVITLCSSPRFTAADSWPGMPAASLARFSSLVADKPVTGLRRFDSLQVAGAARPRQLLRALQALRAGRSEGPLASGLQWLAELDQRHDWPALALPQLHLLAADDQLLAAGIDHALGDLLAANAAAEVDTVAAASHLAPLEQGAAIAARLRDFLDSHGLLRPAHSAPAPMAKSDVALSFSRAAPRYDSVAMLQRDVGTALLDQLDRLEQTPATVLDLGSGTGYFCPELRGRFPAAAYIGLDLAEGMVRYAREHHPGAEAWLVGDAEALPLASHSVDLIFSSLALQWCHRSDLLFAELARVLRPGGRCVFSTLGPQTLRELRAAWAAVDQHQHVNRFLPLEVLQQSLRQQDGLALQVGEQAYRMEYARVGELLNELKTLGAHNVNRDRPAGLGHRRVLQGMMRAYEDWREEGMLPATYQVYFGLLEKS